MDEQSRSQRRGTPEAVCVYCEGSFVYSFVTNLIKRHSVSTECLLFVLLISFRNLLFHASNINLTKPSSLATHKISCPHRAKFWLRRPELLAVSATGGASGSRVLLHFHLFKDVGSNIIHTPGCELFGFNRVVYCPTVYLDTLCVQQVEIFFGECFVVDIQIQLMFF